MTTVQAPLTLGDGSARQLANATKTTAQMTTITPGGSSISCRGSQSRRVSTG